MRGSVSDRLRPWLWLLGLGLALNSRAEVGGALIDPTRPPGYVEPAMAARIAAESSAVQAWSVSMIRVGAERPFAIVNGELVHEGDRLGQARVVRIGARTVQLERNGARFRITISVADVKKKTGSSK